MARLMRLPLNRRRRVVAAMMVVLNILMVYVMVLTYYCQLLLHRLERSPQTRSLIERVMHGQMVRSDFISEIARSSERSLHHVIMDQELFLKLCDLVVTEGGLQSVNAVGISEMLAILLQTIGHNKKNRTLQTQFGRSGKTICKVIKAVLLAILRMHPILLAKPKPVTENSVHPWWKHFKRCLGALDGTHVKVRVRNDDQPRYRNRKGEVSMNVLGVCNPSMEFIYCLSGWEGSVHDGRVLRDALSRPNGLRVAKGSYYLCDAGYANSEGFLTPFRGQRYHLKEWGSNRPNTSLEYYNMKHASAKNVIERAFGVLKARWAILRDTTWFSVDVVARMVNACCLLHNFIKRERGVDRIESQYNQTPTNGNEDAALLDQIEEVVSSIQPTPEWTQFRLDKAQYMWANRNRS